MPADAQTITGAASSGSGRSFVVALDRALGSRWTWIALGTLLLALALIPTWRVPIIGDDFYYTLERYQEYGGSAWNALLNAWHDDLQPNRYNPVGREGSLTNHVLARESSAWWQGDLSHYFRAQTMILVWAATLSAAFALREAIRYVSPANRVGVWPSFAGVAAVVAVVLQLHINSHDPTITIAEVGYGAPIISFALIALAFRIVTDPPRWRRTGAAFAILALAGALYYETIITAIAMSVLVFAVEWWRGRLPWRRLLVLVVTGAAVPAIVAVAGRAWVATQDVPYYRGTDLVIGSEGLKVLANFLLGTAPGTAWPHTVFAVGGAPVTPLAIGFGVAIGVLATIVLTGLLRGALPRMRVTRRLWVVVAIYGGHLVGSYVMHSFTTKYIREVWHHHVVYLAYATGVLMVATAVVAAIAFLPRRPVVLAAPVVLVLATAFAVMQQSVNLAVADYLAQLHRGPALVAAQVATDAGTDEQRCEALRQLSLGNPFHDSARFPGLTEAIEEGYQRDFGTPFCTRSAQIVDEAPPALTE